MNTQELLKIQKEVKQFQEDAHKQEGVLESICKDMRAKFKMVSSATEKQIIKRIEQEIKTLQEQQATAKEEYENLVEQIEEVVKSWEDTAY